MDVNQLLKDYLTKDNEKHERRIGRYYASEVFAVKKGYKTISGFFDEQSFDNMGLSRIFQGIAKEEMLEKVLKTMKVKHQWNTKYELKIREGIVLVVKPDFEFDKVVIETKDTETPDIPEKYIYQLECEHRATGKEVWLGRFGDRSQQFITFIKYEPSIEVWEECQEILITYHEKLLKKFPDKK